MHQLTDFISTIKVGSKYEQEPYHLIGERLPVKITLEQKEREISKVKRQKVDRELFKEKVYNYWKEGLTVLEISRKIKKQKKYVQLLLDKIFKEKGFDLNIRVKNSFRSQY